MQQRPQFVNPHQMESMDGDDSDVVDLEQLTAPMANGKEEESEGKK